MSIATDVTTKYKIINIISEEAVADHSTTSDNKVETIETMPKKNIGTYSLMFFFFEFKKGKNDKAKQTNSGISIKRNAADVLFKLNIVKKQSIIDDKIDREIPRFP